MSAAIKRDGVLVLCYEEPPAFPSRWCRWLGHAWTTTTRRQGSSLKSRWRECERCGASESWYRYDSDEAERAKPE